MEQSFLEKGKDELRELNISSIDHYLAVLKTLGDRINMVSKELEQIVEEREDTRLSSTIPGINTFSAFTILAEIGDIGRFSDPEKLCSYADLCLRSTSRETRLDLEELRKEETNSSVGLRSIAHGSM